jgi:hypothetical protein
MWRWIFRWLAPLVVAGFWSLSRAHAQAASTPDGESGRTPALQYAVAFICTIIVMLIVCTPSRKG